MECWDNLINRITPVLQISKQQLTMIKKVFCLALCAMLFAVCLRAEAQQQGKIFRIGILDTSTASGSAVLWNAFREEMRKLGWIEGKNIAIDYRFAEQKPERLLSLRPTWFVLRLI